MAVVVIYEVSNSNRSNIAVKSPNYTVSLFRVMSTLLIGKAHRQMYCSVVTDP